LVAAALALTLSTANAAAQDRLPVPPTKRTSPEVTGVVTHIVDGDTIDIGKTRIRLFGMDALELHQTCQDGPPAPAGIWQGGLAAADYLRDIVHNKQVTCVLRGNMSYNRYVAVCKTSDNEDLGATMVAQGFALASTYDSVAYIGDERAARTKGVNFWKQGRSCQAPWQWRKQHPFK
jgi:endonuclease YncB( thermonuclease family)